MSKSWRQPLKRQCIVLVICGTSPWLYSISTSKTVDYIIYLFNWLCVQVLSSTRALRTRTRCSRSTCPTRPPGAQWSGTSATSQAVSSLPGSVRMWTSGPQRSLATHLCAQSTRLWTRWTCRSTRRVWRTTRVSWTAVRWRASRWTTCTPRAMWTWTRPTCTRACPPRTTATRRARPVCSSPSTRCSVIEIPRAVHSLRAPGSISAFSW